MTLQARVHTAAEPSFDEVRRSVEAVVAELSRHLDRLAALPAGPTSYVQLAEINDPVRHAVARWDRAVLEHTGTLPLAVDDGWCEDFTD